MQTFAEGAQKTLVYCSKPLFTFALGYPLWLANLHAEMKHKNLQESVRYIIWEHGEPGKEKAKVENLYGGVYAGVIYYATSKLFNTCVNDFLIKRMLLPDDPQQPPSHYNIRRKKMLKMASGIAAALVQNLITHPIKHIMNLMALNGVVYKEDSIHMVTNYVAQNGFKGLYRGIVMSSVLVSLETLFTALEGYCCDLYYLDTIDTNTERATPTDMYYAAVFIGRMGIIVLGEIVILQYFRTATNRTMLSLPTPSFLTGSGLMSLGLELLLHQFSWNFFPKFFLSSFVGHPVTPLI